MPKKKAPRKKAKVSEKQRAEDDELRERLRKADMRVFDKGLKKAVRTPPTD